MYNSKVKHLPFFRNNTTDVTSHEVRLLRDTLSLSVDALNSDSSHLPMQLLGRLIPYVTNTTEERYIHYCMLLFGIIPVHNWCKPVCIHYNTHDACTYVKSFGVDYRCVLKNMVIAALEDNRSLISALQPHFHIPGGPLLITMEGHRDVVSGIDTALLEDSRTGELSLVIVTSSWDKTLKSWDLKTTGVLKTFDGHTDKVLCVVLTTDGQYAVSGSADKTVR